MGAMSPPNQQLSLLHPPATGSVHTQPPSSAWLLMCLLSLLPTSDLGLHVREDQHRPRGGQLWLTGD